MAARVHTAALGMAPVTAASPLPLATSAASSVVVPLSIQSSPLVPLPSIPMLRRQVIPSALSTSAASAPTPPLVVPPSSRGVSVTVPAVEPYIPPLAYPIPLPVPLPLPSVAAVIPAALPITPIVPVVPLIQQPPPSGSAATTVAAVPPVETKVDASIGMNGADVILEDDTHNVAKMMVDVGCGVIGPRLSGLTRDIILLQMIRTISSYQIMTDTVHQSLPTYIPRELVELCMQYTVPLMDLASWHDTRSQWPEAYEVYQLASTYEDNGIAHGKIAVCYVFGLFCVRVDPGRGFIYSQRGWASGDHESLSLIARAWWHGQGSPRIDRQQGAKLYAQGKDPYSLLEYGHLLVFGDHRIDVEHDPPRGHMMMEQAMTELTARAAKDDPRALHTIGLVYARGKCGRPTDWRKAEELYRRASVLGNARSMGNLALTIRDSYDNKHAESLQWDRFAIAQGDLEAMCNYGHSDQEHPERAFALFRRAALAGSHLGMYNMGACYFHGIGVAVDHSAARTWWVKGADMGETDCVTALNTLHAVP